jgi:hypothetical protein
MQKTVSGLIAILGLACCSMAQASPVASIAAMASPAWVQRDDAKNELGRNYEINVGDHVFTGASGLLEIQLWASVELRVYSASEIRIMAQAESGSDPSENLPLLFMQSGRICLESPPASSTGNNFELNVADLLLVAIQQYGHICVSRREGMSTINLRAGSVQITNVLDPGMVILSEAGIEFRMNDEGSYQLLPSSEDATMADMNSEPFIAEAIAKQESPQLDSAETMSDTAVTDDAETVEPRAGSGEKASGYIYTVYLFSTRSEEIANQVNQRFRQAGHKTRILVDENEPPIRYRVAVPGFVSRQSASNFADSIVGKLGIKDTWIGRDRLDSAD